MDIETKNATLDTLSVTIQALHVSGKQMTLAVFRQLPIGDEEELEALAEYEAEAAFDRLHPEDDTPPDDAIAYEQAQIWGTVRYAIKNEGDMWLVFSIGGKLYRRPINTIENQFEDIYNNLESMRHRIAMYENYPQSFSNVTPADLAQLKAQAKATHDHLTACLQEERKRLAEVQTLINSYPQLFIAV